MSNKVLWHSNQTKRSFSRLTEDAKIDALKDRGYDDEMLDGDLDDVIDQDDYMWQDDAEEFQDDIVPMINAQTNGYVIAVNAEDPQSDILVVDAEELVDGDICPEAEDARLVDTSDGLEMQYFDEDDNVIMSLQLFAVPEDHEEEKEFITNVMPDAVETTDEDDEYEVPEVDLTDVETLEDFIDKDALMEYGKRIVSEEPEEDEEDLDEAKSKSPTNLEDELHIIQQEYEAEGPEAFYGLPFEEFERQYPEFTKSVIKTFLKEVVGLTKSELNDLGGLVDEDTGDPYWETGELITDQDWPCLLEGAEMLANGKGIQWEKLYKKYYKSYDESLTEADVLTERDRPHENTARQQRKAAINNLASQKKIVAPTARQLSATQNYHSFVELLKKDVKSEAFLNVLRKFYNDSDIGVLKRVQCGSTSLNVNKLIPTQNNISMAKSFGDPETGSWGPLAKASLFNAILEGHPETEISGEIITYGPFGDDGRYYIIDGHHRWSKVYVVNPKSSIKAFNIGPAEGLSPMDVLKGVQLAIAKNTGNVPGGKVDNPNLLKNPQNEVQQYVTAKLSSEKGQKVLAAYKDPYKDLNNVVKLFCTNVASMAKVGAMKNAPSRTDMPQTGHGDEKGDTRATDTIKNQGIIDPTASKAKQPQQQVQQPAAESLQEDLNLIQLTPNDQATNIRALIKSCWDSVDQFSMFAQQLNEFGSQMALTTVNTLINDLYIAIGSFEEELSTVDPKSTALDAIDQVQAVAQVAPQVATQMAVQPVMIEKFQLSEDLDEPIEEAYIRKEIGSKELWGYINQVLKRSYRRLEDEDGIIDPYDIAQILENKYDISGYDNNVTHLVEDIVDALHWWGKDELSKYNLQLKQAPDNDYYLVPIGFEFEESLSEDLDEKPEAQEELEEPIEKELKEVEKYRKEKVNDSLNPDPEDTIEETSDMTMVEDLGDDESYNPKFFESLLKLED